MYTSFTHTTTANSTSYLSNDRPISTPDTYPIGDFPNVSSTRLGSNSHSLGARSPHQPIELSLPDTELKNASLTPHVQI
jgi:hypothetical protein